MSLRLPIFALLGLLVTVRVGRADEVLPQAQPASKYAKMASRSPFAPPTTPSAVVAAPTPPPVPGWADSLTATMIMRDGDKYMVTVVDSQSPQHLYLTSVPDRTTQMAVASVKWGGNHDDPPTVTLSKGREFAQVKYESGAVSPGGTNQMGGGGPPIPGAARNLLPGGQPLANAQPFHPPLPNGGQSGNQMPNSSTIRRPIIRAPVSAAPPAGARPGPGQPNGVARPNPAVKVDDDDDDD